MPQQNRNVNDNPNVKRRRKKASRACSHCQKVTLKYLILV
jgi:hypothetical protein